MTKPYMPFQRILSLATNYVPPADIDQTPSWPHPAHLTWLQRRRAELAAMELAKKEGSK